jgi:hypothetical protein
LGGGVAVAVVAAAAAAAAAAEGRRGRCWGRVDAGAAPWPHDSRRRGRTKQWGEFGVRGRRGDTATSHRSASPLHKFQHPTESAYFMPLSSDFRPTTAISILSPCSRLGNASGQSHFQNGTHGSLKVPKIVYVQHKRPRRNCWPNAMDLPTKYAQQESVRRDRPKFTVCTILIQTERGPTLSL